MELGHEQARRSVAARGGCWSLQIKLGPAGGCSHRFLSLPRTSRGRSSSLLFRYGSRVSLPVRLSKKPPTISPSMSVR